MPVRIPTYDGPKVERANLSGGENTTRALPIERGQTANLVAGALSAAGELGDRIQQRRDLDEAFRVETQIASDYSAFDQNLRKTRRGADATGVVNDVDQWWAKVDQTHGKDVSPRVKEMTKKSLARIRAQALERIGNYQMAEEDRAQVQSFNAVNGQEIQNAITDGKPEVIASAREKIGAAVRAFGATRDWGADEIAAETQKWASMLHQQAVNAIIDRKVAEGGGPMKAKEYFEANRAEIDSVHHARISGMIDKAVTERKAVDNAAEWASLPFEDAIGKAREIADPDERKLTISAVRQLQEEKTIAQNLREKEISDKVWQQVASGVPMAKLPKALLEQMDGRERMQVNAHYEAERKRRVAESQGKAVKTDFAVLEGLLKLPDDQFNKTVLSTYQDRISQGHLVQLLDRQMKMRNPKQAGDVASTEQQMGSYIKSMGLKDEKVGAFTMAAYNEFNQFRAANKREPDYDERKKILERLSTSGEVLLGSMWKIDPDKMYFETTEDERAKFAPDIPDVDRAGLTAEFVKKHKRQPTKAELITAFRNLKGF